MELDPKVQGVINQIAAQRNNAMNEAAELAGEVVSLRAEIEALKKKLADAAPPAAE